MPQRTLRLVALDGAPGDLERLRGLVAGLPGAPVEFEACPTLGELQLALARGAHDVLILAERVGQVSGHEILCDLRRAGHALPVVLWGDGQSDDSVGRAIRAGAAEYLSKRELTRERLAAALAWAAERRPGALPERAGATERLCLRLEGAVTPTLEAARASVDCLLAGGALPEAARHELAQVSKLCGEALASLERMLDEVRRA